MKSKGFTLIELLVVFAIISLLSSIVLASLKDVRSKTRDTKRVQDIKQLQIALEAYRNDHSGYPAGLAQPRGSCDGTFQTALQPLVSKGYISEIPSDPVNVDGGGGRFCYFYYVNTNCGASGVTVASYAIRFHTEKLKLSLPSWFNQGFASGGHYCVLAP